MKTLRQFSLKAVLTLQPTSSRATIRMHQRLYLKLEKAKLHHAFTEACIRQHLIPNFLRCRLPQQLKNQHHLLRRGQRKTLIKVNKENIQTVKERERDLREFENLHAADVTRLRSISQASSHTELQSMKAAQQVKLQNLAKKTGNEPSPPNSIYNLSNRHLDATEREALQYGMGMCWPQQPKELDVKIETEILFRKIKKMESMTADQEDDIKTKLKSTVRLMLKKKEKIPKKVAQLFKALKKLCQEKDLYISRLDKGNGVVLMNKSQYVSKMNTILNDPKKFKEVKSDGNVFIKKEDQLNRKLLQLKKKGEISEDVYKQVRSTGCQPSRLYGLPKVHKDNKDPPLRPILSMVNSYCSPLSQWLLSFLSPLSPSKFCVKDSFVAADKITATPVHDLENLFLVSFDAKQLFTNIPVDDTIEHILKTVPDNQIPVSKETLKILLNMACTNVPFIFNGKTFNQIDGLSMGSCLAPLTAEFALHMIEVTLTESRLTLFTLCG